MADRPPQDKGLPTVDLGGKYVTQYNSQIALRIVERLAQGETLNAICKGKPGMPHPTTFKRWMVNQPELAKAYETAMRVSASALEEEALDTGRAIAALPKDGTHVRAAEVKMAQLRWSAERRDPTRFGQRTQVNVKVPVTIITPLDLGGSVGASIPDIYTIEARPMKTVQEVEGKELVAEKPVGRRPQKRVLIPANGEAPPTTPFSKLMRGEDNGTDDVRQEGRFPGEQGNPRPRDDGVPESGGEGRREEGGQESEPGPEGSAGRDEEGR